VLRREKTNSTPDDVWRATLDTFRRDFPFTPVRKPPDDPPFVRVAPRTAFTGRYAAVNRRPPGLCGSRGPSLGPTLACRNCRAPGHVERCLHGGFGGAVSRFCGTFVDVTIAATAIALRMSLAAGPASGRDRPGVGVPSFRSTIGWPATA